MPDEPGGHVSPVGPACHADFARVREAEFLDRIDPCHNVAPGTVSGVIHDRPLVGVAQIVAAAVVRREHHISVRDHELGKETELRGRGGLGSAMNYQYQWIFAVLLEIRRVEEHTIFLEAVRAFPFEFLRFAKSQGSDFMIEIRQASRSVVCRRHVVQLRRLRRRASGEGDLAFAANARIHPERPRWADIAKRQFFGGACQRLQPK